MRSCLKHSSRCGRYSVHAASKAAIRPRASYLWSTRQFLIPPVNALRPRLIRSIGSQSSSFQDATIYALSTAPGRAAIAVIRCSGSLCTSIYEELCPGSPPLKPRRAAVRTLFRPDSQEQATEVLDSAALVLYFPGPNTATGEDVLEFHVHGGPAIVKAVLSSIPTAVQSSARAGIRYAEPGEFTRRAFYNDRLDLTQVEALGDTLSAETEQQRRLAVRGMSNTLNERYEKWRNQLLAVRGELEALIDFSEDQHFDESAEEFVHSISTQIQTLLSHIRKTTRNAARGELLRHGIKIALLGAPNAGKSSLLNQIVGREAAIVSSEAGTTRDVIEVNVDIQGYFCRFNDLAGVRSQILGQPGISNIEQEGIARAKAQARQADVVVVVIPVGWVEHDSRGSKLLISTEIMDFVKNELREEQQVLFVLNKSDLAGQNQNRLIHEANQLLQRYTDRPRSIFPVSCLKAAAETHGTNSDSGGLQAFLNGLSKTLGSLTEAEQIETGGNEGGSFDESLGTTQRQQALLEQCANELTAFLDDTKSDGQTGEGEIDVVLAAEHLRCAADYLARITGRGESGDVEEVLGVVFEKFCVGK